MKTNTTLKTLILGRIHKKRASVKINVCNNDFLFHIKIDNGIEDTGATSLSDALKSNKTLAKLDLKCEDKTSTQITPINKRYFSFLSNQQATRLKVEEQHH